MHVMVVLPVKYVTLGLPRWHIVLGLLFLSEFEGGYREEWWISFLRIKGGQAEIGVAAVFRSGAV